MKKFVMFLFFLSLSISYLNSPGSEIPEGDIVDKWMFEYYPNWWEFQQKDRDAIKKMFEESYDKHKWFPDKFDKPTEKTFYITPRNR